MNIGLLPRSHPRVHVRSRSLAARLQTVLTDGLREFPWPVIVSDWTGNTYTTGGTQGHWCGSPLEFHFKTEGAGQDAVALRGMSVLERFLAGELDIRGNLYVLTNLRDYFAIDLSAWRLLRALSTTTLFQTVARARLNVRSHYDIPQAALEIYLDKRYMAYSCAMFEQPDRFDARELTTAGSGEGDTFDSLEKAQWRKFKDAVDFVNPRAGDTMLDVGCGYGGQLEVALATHPFGKVVGCTHSSNQLAAGRARMSRFPSSCWEITQSDYREDHRVFDHVTSTGMACHVGPRGLVPYVRNIRARIKRGGRYVHHVLMTPYIRKPLDAEVGAAFNKKYVWPGFHWFTMGDHVKALEQNGFEIQRAVNLAPHYAKTAAAWYERMMARADESRRLLGSQTFRAWQIYLGGGSGSVQSRKSHVYRMYCVAV